MARIQIALGRWGNTSLEVMKAEELQSKFNSISDEEVQSCLNSVESNYRNSTSKVSQIHSEQSLDRFFDAIGLTATEAESLIRFLSKNFLVSSLDELKRLDERDLAKALNEVIKNN